MIGFTFKYVRISLSAMWRIDFNGAGEKVGRPVGSKRRVPTRDVGGLDCNFGKDRKKMDEFEM